MRSNRLSREAATYVDRPETSAVTGGHIGVEGLDGVGPGHLAVLLVHVVGAGARIVTDPEAEVLDLEGVLLVDLQELSAVVADIMIGCSYSVPRCRQRSHRWPS